MRLKKFIAPNKFAGSENPTKTPSVHSHRALAVQLKAHESETGVHRPLAQRKTMT